MPSTDEIGTRGEAIFVALLTQPYGTNRDRLFRAHFLGEKFATLDFLVELTGLRRRMAHFFVQVKTTTRGYTGTVPPKLKVNVSQKDIDRMINYPAPTYVIGIDEPDELGFIASVNGSRMKQLAGLSTIYPLDQLNLKRLRDEVDRYWRVKDMVLENSVFTI
jgi:hypothetical protein